MPLRRLFTLSIILLPLCCGLLQAAKRNVVLIVTDDQGQDAGCYGNPVIQLSPQSLDSS